MKRHTDSLRNSNVCTVCGVMMKLRGGRCVQSSHILRFLPLVIMILTALFFPTAGFKNSIISRKNKEVNSRISPAAR